MKKYLGVLFIIGLVEGVLLLLIHPHTGYMDADYYFAGAKTLFATGTFQDYYLWNYLLDSTSLPIPSHTYWMPLASLVGAFGMILAQNASLMAARLPFVLLFACSVPLITWTAYRFHQNRLWAIISGILLLSSGYFLKFVTQPDAFAILFVLGSSLIGLLGWKPVGSTWPRLVLIGVVCGLIHLTRADGLIWLPIIILAEIFAIARNSDHKMLRVLRIVLFVMLGYLTVTSSWFIRNYSAFGNIFPPGGGKALFLLNYDQLFSYPPAILNQSNYLAAGIGKLIAIRLSALTTNSLNLIVTSGMIVLVPFLIAGYRKYRYNHGSHNFLVGLMVLFGVMTIIFPFAGARGGLLHSLALVQPWFALLIPMGFSRMYHYLSTRYPAISLSETQAMAGMVLIPIVISCYIVISDVQSSTFQNQSQEWKVYQMIDEEFIQDQDKRVAVVVNNPPGYYAATNRSAIMIPYGDENTILQVAKKYQAKYLLLDQNHIPAFNDLYASPEEPLNSFSYRGRIDQFVIFQLDVTNAME